MINILFLDFTYFLKTLNELRQLRLACPVRGQMTWKSIAESPRCMPMPDNCMVLPYIYV